MNEALFYKKLSDKKVQCKLCPRNCTISEGKVGFCGVRKNIDGKLYSLVYNNLHSVGIDPIEKKPFYHFYPGSKALSICTVGCNFRCKFCCNFHISQKSEIEGEEVNPKEIVELALKNNCKGISYTYTEYTVYFEYALEIAKMARKKGLFNCVVTNGYTSLEAVDKMSKYLDAAVIDIKGSLDKEFLKKYCSVPDPKPIYDSMKRYVKNNVHVEITNLIIPGIGDSLKKAEKLIKWVKNNLGQEIPLHFISFFPTYKLLNIQSTPVRTLEKVVKIAEDLGMKYCYIGNVHDHPKNNTYCPKCSNLLIKRLGCSLVKNNIRDGKCMKCGYKIYFKF